MASAKNTTRKPSTAKKTNVEPVTTVENVVETIVKKELTADTNVPVRCNLRNVSMIQDGILIYSNDATGARYKWFDYGDVCYIPFRELTIMKGKQPRFFEDGWISIDNYLDFNLADEVISALGIEDTMGYMRGKNFENMMDVLKITDYKQFESELAAMPKTLYPIVAKTAKAMVASGELKDINILLAIRRVYPSFEI